MLLQRVIRLVGVGSLDKQSAQGLEDVLVHWAQNDNAVEPFLPKSPAAASDLTSAAQYLLANNRIGSETAETFSAWLRTALPSSSSSTFDGGLQGAPDFPSKLDGLL